MIVVTDSQQIWPYKAPSPFHNALNFHWEPVFCFPLLIIDSRKLEVIKWFKSYLHSSFLTAWLHVYVRNRISLLSWGLQVSFAIGKQWVCVSVWDLVELSEGCAGKRIRDHTAQLLPSQAPSISIEEMYLKGGRIDRLFLQMWKVSQKPNFLLLSGRKTSVNYIA